jgi:hypothetical protein
MKAKEKMLENVNFIINIKGKNVLWRNSNNEENASGHNYLYTHTKSQSDSFRKTLGLFTWCSASEHTVALNERRVRERLGRECV